MRAAVVAGVLAVTAAFARPAGAPEVPFFLKLPTDAHLAATYARDRAPFDRFDSQASEAPGGGGLHFGPISAEAVTDTRPGRKHKTVMQYHVEGLSMFGGDIGGHLGGRGAMLTLRWKSAP